MFGESCTGRVYLNMYEANTILEGLQFLEQFSRKDKKKLQQIKDIRKKITKSYLGEIITDGVEE